MSVIEQGIGIIYVAFCIVKQKSDRVSLPVIECLRVTVLDDDFTWLKLFGFSKKKIIWWFFLLACLQIILNLRLWWSYGWIWY